MKKYTSSMPYPFARAVEANGFLFLSGQLSMNGKGEPVRGTVEEQTRQIMKNIIATLEECDSSLDKIVKVTVWLSDMSHFQAFNDTYRSHFPDGFPARSTVVSRLAFDLDVELEVQALA
ncbi:RidA family protein [Klebsiella pneumoniae]|uniref:RidA family protein n=1 Tax=Klebsiella pneumoniae TaxID=573 RepID=UPI0015EAD950|nr:RidA family protein [Klebsiella pneumoniae]QLS79478.1 RidA family protein [Klebsiella pneumoniae]